MKPAPAIAPDRNERLRALFLLWLTGFTAAISNLIGPNTPHWLMHWLDHNAYWSERVAQKFLFASALRAHKLSLRRKHFTPAFRSHWRHAMRCGFATARHLRADQRLARVLNALRNPQQHLARYLKKLRNGFRTIVPTVRSTCEALTSAPVTTSALPDTS